MLGRRRPGGAAQSLLRKSEMPTYVYECSECEHRFEVFQSFSAKAMRKCPQCRRSALRKVLFPAGVVFKGSGFYVNDSRSAAAKSKAKSDSDGGKGSGGEGDKGKTDGSPKKESSAKDGSSKKGEGSASRKEPAATGSKSGS